MPAGSKDNDNPLYSVNRDRYLGFSETWRVYRGTEYDDIELYRAEGKWWHGYGAKMQIYSGKGDNSKHVGSLQQAVNEGYEAGSTHPDQFTVEVNEDEDAGLLMLLSLIIDHVDDKDDSPRVDTDPDDDEVFA